MSNEPTLRTEIALVEARLAQRRRRTTEDFHEAQLRARETARRAVNWVPLALIVAIVVAGAAVGRRRVPASIAAAGGAGVVGGLMAFGGTALRFALSPQGRALWQRLRSTNTSRRGMRAAN
jgi:hypothetical protein